MDLYIELREKIDELFNSIDDLKKTSEEYANAYTKYRKEVAKELIRLKEQGTPATLSNDLARGKEDIANLKYQEICKEGIYKANQESINAIKLVIKVLENQISREYGRGEYDGKI